MNLAILHYQSIFRYYINLISFNFLEQLQLLKNSTMQCNMIGHIHKLNKQTKYERKKKNRRVVC